MFSVCRSKKCEETRIYLLSAAAQPCCNRDIRSTPQPLGIQNPESSRRRQRRPGCEAVTLKLSYCAYLCPSVKCDGQTKYNCTSTLIAHQSACGQNIATYIQIKNLQKYRWPTVFKMWRQRSVLDAGCRAKGYDGGSFCLLVCRVCRQLEDTRWLPGAGLTGGQGGGASGGCKRATVELAITVGTVEPGSEGGGCGGCVAVVVRLLPRLHVFRICSRLIVVGRTLRHVGHLNILGGRGGMLLRSTCDLVLRSGRGRRNNRNGWGERERQGAGPRPAEGPRRAEWP